MVSLSELFRRRQGPLRPGTDVERFEETGESALLIQGPVRPGTDERTFRTTGRSVPTSGGGSSGNATSPGVPTTSPAVEESKEQEEEAVQDIIVQAQQEGVSDAVRNARIQQERARGVNERARLEGVSGHVQAVRESNFRRQEEQAEKEEIQERIRQEKAGEREALVPTTEESFKKLKLIEEFGRLNFEMGKAERDKIKAEQDNTRQLQQLTKEIENSEAHTGKFRLPFISPTGKEKSIDEVAPAQVLNQVFDKVSSDALKINDLIGKTFEGTPLGKKAFTTDRETAKTFVSDVGKFTFFSPVFTTTAGFSSQIAKQVGTTTSAEAIALEQSLGKNFIKTDVIFKTETGSGVEGVGIARGISKVKPVGSAGSVSKTLFLGLTKPLGKTKDVGRFIGKQESFGFEKAIKEFPDIKLGKQISVSDTFTTGGGKLFSNVLKRGSIQRELAKRTELERIAGITESFRIKDLTRFSSDAITRKGDLVQTTGFIRKLRPKQKGGTTIRGSGTSLIQEKAFGDTIAGISAGLSKQTPKTLPSFKPFTATTGSLKLNVKQSSLPKLTQRQPLGLVSASGARQTQQTKQRLNLRQESLLGSLSKQLPKTLQIPKLAQLPKQQTKQRQGLRLKQKGIQKTSTRGRSFIFRIPKQPRVPLVPPPLPDLKLKGLLPPPRKKKKGKRGSQQFLAESFTAKTLGLAPLKLTKADIPKELKRRAGVGSLGRIPVIVRKRTRRRRNKLT